MRPHKYWLLNMGSRDESSMAHGLMSLTDDVKHWIEGGCKGKKFQPIDVVPFPYQMFDIFVAQTPDDVLLFHKSITTISFPGRDLPYYACVDLSDPIFHPIHIDGIHVTMYLVKKPEK